MISNVIDKHNKDIASLDSFLQECISFPVYRINRDFGVVGAGRLELPTSWSRTKRAAKLRYAPTDDIIV